MVVAVSPGCSVPMRADFSCVSTIPAVLHAARASVFLFADLDKQFLGVCALARATEGRGVGSEVLI